MREDEGRKLLKPQMILKILRVRNVVPKENRIWYPRVNSILQKVRFKKYVLTKADMRYLNEIYLLFTNAKGI